MNEANIFYIHLESLASIHIHALMSILIDSSFAFVGIIS